MSNSPETESVIDEIHRVRREISDRFGGDVFAIAEDARKRQAASGRPEWPGHTDERAAQVVVQGSDQDHT